MQISNIELFKNATTHHATGNPATATTDINNAAQHAFTVTAPEDPAGPNRVLVRDANAQVFLVVRYSL